MSLPVLAPSPGFHAPPSLRSSSARTRVPVAGLPLQRVSLEISRRCNLQCIYCYAEATPTTRTGLADGEIGAVLREAVDLGACLVSFVSGGEPLLRPSLLTDGVSCIDQANALGCYTYLYTNCTLVDERAARWLAARDVSVVGKLNSLDDAVQDELAGVRGSARRIRAGVDALLEAGFAQDSPSRLSLETIICRQNYDELPTLWRWMRDRNIVPEVEIPTPSGRAGVHRDALFFTDAEAPAKYRDLFAELLRVDRAEYGCDWVPHPPFPAGSCQLFYSNCYVNDRGGVQPCAGVDHELGVLRVGPRAATGTTLAAVLDADGFRKLRAVPEHLGAPCRGCDLLPWCYGCRGKAFHRTGDYFAGDPVCWRRPADVP